MGFFRKNNGNMLPPDMEDFSGFMKPQNLAADSFDHVMGMNMAHNSFEKRDAEVIIKLFSVNPTTKNLITSLTGKFYDKEKNKVIQIGTAHINDKGLREFMPLINGLINDSVTKGRLDYEIIEDFNAEVYILISFWLLKNRKMFDIKKESIRFISQIFTQLHYSILSRSLEGKEGDNTLIHTLKHTDNSNENNISDSYYNKLFKKTRIGR